MVTTKKIIIPFEECASGIITYMELVFPNFKSPKVLRTFVYDYLYQYITSQINSASSVLIQIPASTIDSHKTLTDFCHRHDLKIEIVQCVFDAYVGIDNLLYVINENMGSHGFDMCSIYKEYGMWFFINDGDYRIIEWEKEHVINGKYKS